MEAGLFSKRPSLSSLNRGREREPQEKGAAVPLLSLSLFLKPFHHDLRFCFDGGDRAFEWVGCPPDPRGGPTNVMVVNRDGSDRAVACVRDGRLETAAGCDRQIEGIGSTRDGTLSQVRRIARSWLSMCSDSTRSALCVRNTTWSILRRDEGACRRASKSVADRRSLPVSKRVREIRGFQTRSLND